MNVTSLSSTSLSAAKSCLARFKAEYTGTDRIHREQGGAAAFGTCVHATLEVYVKMAYLENKMARTWAALLELWEMQYAAAYGSLNRKEPNFKLGVELLQRWYDRDDLGSTDREVVSLEEKKKFKITVDKNEVSITYIRDRLDMEISSGKPIVVDYKTSVYPVSPDEMFTKIQPRIYALATQIEYPNAPGVWVEFDMLRHERQPTAVYFSYEENQATWRALKSEIRKILAAPDDPAPTLNDECLFCSIKTTCKAVLSQRIHGGAMSLEVPEMVDRLVELKYQQTAAKKAAEELEGKLIAICKDQDTFELSGNVNAMEVRMSRRRGVDAERVAKIVGPELWAQYGSSSIGIGVVDELLEGDRLTEEQKAELRDLITTTLGEPYLKPKKQAGLGGK